MSKGKDVLRRLWEGWKRFGRKMGDIQARVLLVFFYFVILSPFAMAVRLWGDPMAIKANTPRGWRSRSDRDGTPMERATSQF